MVGMADGFAQACGSAARRQPAHRARGRQRDGRDLQRAGQPLAAARHRRPAGAVADHPAGEPHQPRRDPRCRTRYVKWSFEPPRAEDVPLALAQAIHLAALPPRGPGRSSRSRWTTGTPRSTTATAAEAIARQVTRPRGRRPRGGPRPRRAPRRRRQPGARRRPRHRRQRRLGRRRRARRAPAAAGLGDAGHRRQPASASPRATRTSAACCRRRSARSARRSRATT